MIEHSVSSWFLIVLQLSLYGLLATGAAVYQFFRPSAQPTVLFELHAGIGRGALMLGGGIAYTVAFRPGRHPSTGKTGNLPAGEAGNSRRSSVASPTP